jgi:hypothetical protein
MVPAVNELRSRHVVREILALLITHDVNDRRKAWLQGHEPEVSAASGTRLCPVSPAVVALL